MEDSQRVEDCSGPESFERAGDCLLGLSGD